MVSVIIPNYNHAPYLRQRIDSVLNQTYQDFEVILLDDCSTDNSKEIVEQYRNHPKISHIIYNDQNSGSPFKQWKKGIDLAKGEYVWIAESDDVADSTFLEVLIKGTEINSNIGISFCDSIWIDKDQKIINQPDNKIEDIVFYGNNFIIENFSIGNPIYNASMAIFKKEVFCKVNNEIYLTMSYCGDWYFWILLAEHCQIFKTSKPLNYFRRHEGSVSARANKLGLYLKEGILILKYIKNKFTFRKKIYVFKIWSWIWYNSNLSTSLNTEIFFAFLSSFPLVSLFYLKNKLWVSLKKLKAFR